MLNRNFFSKETRTKCLRERIAALRGTQNLVVLDVLSRLFRSVRLALHLAQTLIPRSCNTKPLLGDWLIIFLAIILIGFLFKTLWHHEPASKVQIRLADKVYGTFSLNQNRSVTIHGAMGDAVIKIEQGKVRFQKSPCTNQYCVHQGWLHTAGQAAICLPNQISVELIGNSKPYDSVSY